MLRPLSAPPCYGDGDPLAMVTRGDLAKLLKVHVRTIDRITKRPGFPRPVVIEKRCVRWRAVEVSEWLETRRRVRT
jgi:predicted DNA-binding transcriptional regulator AlpA